MRYFSLFLFFMIYHISLVMEEALKSVLDGKMNCNEAAKKFNLGKTTLYEKIKKIRERNKVKKEKIAQS